MENNNNQPLENNNNNPPSLLSLLGFEEGLGRNFNSLPKGNAEGLDFNVTALVNVLTGINLRINYAERNQTMLN